MINRIKKALLVLSAIMIFIPTVSYCVELDKKNEVYSIILAGGSGSRMKSSIPKVLHKIDNVALVDHVINLARSIQSKGICLVSSPSLKEELSTRGVDLVIQPNPLGTANAVLSALPWFKDKNGDIFILYGDTPFIKKETLENMRYLKREKNLGIVILGMRPNDVKRYGRIFLDSQGYVDRIVEHKDGTQEELKNNLCNSGVFLVEAKYLHTLLQEVDNKNAAGEYYLTDIVKIAKKRGINTGVVEAKEEELLGVNTQDELKLIKGKKHY